MRPPGRYAAWPTSCGLGFAPHHSLQVVHRRRGDAQPAPLPPPAARGATPARCPPGARSWRHTCRASSSRRAGNRPGERRRRTTAPSVRSGERHVARSRGSSRRYQALVTRGLPTATASPTRSSATARSTLVYVPGFISHVELRWGGAIDRPLLRAARLVLPTDPLRQARHGALVPNPGAPAARGAHGGCPGSDERGPALSAPRSWGSRREARWPPATSRLASRVPGTSSFQESTTCPGRATATPTWPRSRSS